MKMAFSKLVIRFRSSNTVVVNTVFKKMYTAYFEAFSKE